MFPDLSKYQIRWDRYRKWKIEKDFMTEIMWFMRMEWYLCFHPADVWLSDKFLDLFFLWCAMNLEKYRVQANRMKNIQSQKIRGWASYLSERTWKKKSRDSKGIYIFTENKNI